MKRSENRILTTHVGSLIRPPAVLAHAPGTRQTELKKAVADIVAQQAEGRHRHRQ